MIMGRQRKPDEVHRMQGTYSPSAHGKKGDKAVVVKNAPEDTVYPDFLPEDCYEYYDQLATKLANAKMYSTHYSESLGLAAQQMRIIKDCTEVLMSEGLTYETTNGSLQVRPEQRIRMAATMQLTKLLADMGLTLIGSQKLRQSDVIRKHDEAAKPNAKPAAKDPWDQLRPAVPH